MVESQARIEKPRNLLNREEHCPELDQTWLVLLTNWVLYVMLANYIMLGLKSIVVGTLGIGNGSQKTNLA